MTTVQQIINALLLGGLLALVALGFSLVWGIMNVINLAHGTFIMLGAYTAYWMFSLWGVDPFLSIPVAMLLLFVLGAILQVSVINFIVRAPVLATLLVTFGLEILITNIALKLWTADVRSVQTHYAGRGIALGSLSIPYNKLGALVLALIITALLWLFLERTKLGRAIRATAYDQVGARAVGINIGRMYALTFGIGAALAGAAGALISTTSAITPMMGSSYTIRAFAICVLGGLGSVTGALVGGLLFGFIEVFGVVWIGPGYSDAIVFLVLVLVLIMRPQGILGRAFSAGVQEAGGA